MEYIEELEMPKRIVSLQKNLLFHQIHINKLLVMNW